MLVTSLNAHIGYDNSAKIAKNAPECLAEIDKIKAKFGLDQI